MGEVGRRGWGDGVCVCGGGGVGKHPATDELAPSQVNSLHAVENDSPVTRVHRYISFSIHDSLGHWHCQCRPECYGFRERFETEVEGAALTDLYT